MPKQFQQHIQLPVFGMEIQLEVTGKNSDGYIYSGTITSDLHDTTGEACGHVEEWCVCSACIDAKKYNAAVSVIESLVLAHAAAGVDVRSPAYLEGIETAVEAAGQMG